MTIRVTSGGRAVARSGLLPTSANELLGFLTGNSSSLLALATQCAESDADDCNDFAFAIIYAVYGSSEYFCESPRRFLPYQLLTGALTGPQARVNSIVPQRHPSDALNAAILATRWISGTEMRSLESALDIRSGVLTGLFADAANIIRGLADVIYAVTTTQPTEELPASVDPSTLQALSQLIAPIRRIASRLDKGLPDDVVWMWSIVGSSTALLTRPQILKLRNAGFLSPEQILDPGKFPQLIHAFGAPSAATSQSAQDLQGAVRSWRSAERARLIDSQRRRLPEECRDLLTRFYRAREKEFEDAVEEIFICFDIAVDAKDDGSVSSFPDFVTAALPPQNLALECKSKTVGEAVTFNDATDVIRKAGVNGYKDSFKVTICQPYISPDVPRKLASCDDLSVVNAEDFAEAFVRLKIGKITKQDLADWLTTPGQALKENLSSNTANTMILPEGS